MKDNLVVIAVSEVFLKKGNRKLFFRVLKRNIQAVLRDLPVRVVEMHGRLMVIDSEATLDSAAEQKSEIDIIPVLERLKRVFGIHSVMPARQVNPDLEQIKALSVDYLREQITPEGTSFRVQTRRPNKRFPIRSVDVNREVGIHLFEEFPQLTLELRNPELCLHVELGQRLSFIHRGRIGMSGGLPVGTSGRVLLLLSGGLDSPIAGYLAMKRGCQVDALYFHSFPYISDHAKEKVRELGRLLARYQGTLRLHVAPFTKIQEAIRNSAPSRQYVLLYRRFMLRIAEQLAAKIRADALVTGESIAQVASQTLANIRCIEAAIALPIIRPVVTCDKDEVVRLSRQLDFFDVSTQPHDDCCSLFVDKHPETRGKQSFLEKLEQQLPVDELVAEALEGIESFDLEPTL